MSSSQKRELTDFMVQVPCVPAGTDWCRLWIRNVLLAGRSFIFVFVMSLKKASIFMARLHCEWSSLLTKPGVFMLQWCHRNISGRCVNVPCILDTTLNIYLKRWIILGFNTEEAFRTSCAIKTTKFSLPPFPMMLCLEVEYTQPSLQTLEWTGGPHAIWPPIKMNNLNISSTFFFF